MLREWQAGVAKAPKLLRTKKTAKRTPHLVDAKDPETVRARHSTANRL
jgi:hypothetical protein